MESACFDTFLTVFLMKALQPAFDLPTAVLSGVQMANDLQDDLLL